MPVTIPYTFTTGSGIRSDYISANWKAIRDYLNSGIVKDDILLNTIKSEDIIGSEGIGSTNDRLGTSADFYNHFNSSDLLERSYMTATLKPVQDFTTSPSYVTIPESGKKITLEGPALIIYHAWIQPVYPTDGRLALAGPGNYAVGTDQTIYLQIDGVRYNPTKALAFTEGTTIPANSGSAAATLCVRRGYPLSYFIHKSPGVYDISLVIDSTVDYGFISSKSVTIEILYF